MTRPLAHLSALRSFESAARLQSFQKAADELNISPSAVSHNIRALEDYLQAKLFIRKTRAILLSDIGHILYDDIEKGFRHLELGIKKVQKAHGHKVLTISTGPAIAAKWLIPRLFDFEEKYPDIDIRLSTTNRVIDLAREDIDIAIRHGKGIYEGCFSTFLFEEIYAPTCTPEIAKRLSEPQDILKERLLFDDQAQLVGNVPTWETWFEEMGLDVSAIPKGQHFKQGDHAIQACLYGNGILFARMSLARPDLNDGRLVIPFGKTIKSNFGNYFVTLPGREKEPLIQAFLNWLKSEINVFHRS